MPVSVYSERLLHNNVRCETSTTILGTGLCSGKFMAVIYWLEKNSTRLHTNLTFPISESVSVVKHTRGGGRQAATVPLVGD